MQVSDESYPGHSVSHGCVQGQNNNAEHLLLRPVTGLRFALVTEP